MARRAKDGSWYAAALNYMVPRDYVLVPAFLGSGESTATLFRDAADADAQPTHYVKEAKTFKAGDKVTFRLAAGGGFVAKFTKK